MCRVCCVCVSVLPCVLRSCVAWAVLLCTSLCVCVCVCGVCLMGGGSSGCAAASNVYVELCDPLPWTESSDYQRETPCVDTECTSCEDAVEQGVTTDGIVTITLGGERTEVWCDASTDNGGWTLVYAYSFNAFDSFSDSSNAVTPIP